MLVKDIRNVLFGGNTEAHLANLIMELHSTAICACEQGLWRAGEMKWKARARVWVYPLEGVTHAAATADLDSARIDIS